MKTSLFRPFLLAALASTTLLSACKDDKEDPTPDEDNEQITTLIYTLTPTGGGTPVVVQYRDLDGDGGTAPTIGTLTLAPNTTYTGTLELKDETKTPAENTTAEIQEKAEEHLFFYEPSGTNLTVTRTDKDKNNLEIGLTTQAVTGAANTTGTTGTLKITLRHQPGSKNGTFTPGSTDVEVNFPTVVR